MTKLIPLAAAMVLILSATGVAAAGHGWDHSNGPDVTGQPGAECGDEDAPNRPGNAESAPGSAFNPDGNAGTHYAGEQPQNSRNTASVSQYDTACLHQPK